MFLCRNGDLGVLLDDTGSLSHVPQRRAGVEACFHCFGFRFGARASTCGSVSHVFPLSIFYILAPFLLSPLVDFYIFFNSA